MRLGIDGGIGGGDLGREEGADWGDGGIVDPAEGRVEAEVAVDERFGD